MSDVVQCIDCVADFKTDCADAAAVPQFMTPYPAACRAASRPPPRRRPRPHDNDDDHDHHVVDHHDNRLHHVDHDDDGPTTTTTTTSTTTTDTGPPTTTTTTSTTTTTTGAVTPTILDFTLNAAGGICGDSRNASNVVIKNLTCGGLNIGGGGSQIPEGPAAVRVGRAAST